ncbi:MAG TPA: hypothetical protein VGN51_13865 [Acidimicrobiia bacterium]
MKIVHTGIEYADTELIAHAYKLLRAGTGLTNDEVAWDSASSRTTGFAPCSTPASPTGPTCHRHAPLNPMSRLMRAKHDSLPCASVKDA